MKKLLKLSICALGLGMMLTGMSSMAMEENNADSINLAKVYNKEIGLGKSKTYAYYYARQVVLYGMGERMARDRAERFAETYERGFNELRRSGKSDVYAHFYAKLTVEGRDNFETSRAAEIAERLVESGHSIEYAEKYLFEGIDPDEA